jgi:HEAT repeat protein
MKMYQALGILLLGGGFVWAQQGASDAKDRARSIRELAKTASSTSIPQIQGYLRDPDLEVRLEAVKAIVAIGTHHSIDPLIEASRDNDPEMQIRATDGLVNFYYPGYVQTGLTASLKRVGTSIKGKFTDTNDQVIDGYVQVRPEVIDALAKLVKGGVTLEVRANAARAVGVLRGKAAIPDLIASAKGTKDTQIIYEVLVALQKIRDPESANEIAFLLNDLNQKVQIAAIETTGLLQNRSAAPRLVEVFRRSEDKKVKRAALTSLAMLPEESSRALYDQCLNDKDEGIRAAAAEGIARLKNPADADRMEKLFQAEKKMNPRLSAAFAAVMLGRREMSEFSPLQYLINTLNSASYKGVASAFLIELARDASVRKSLYPGMPQRSKEEKIGLAIVLSRSGEADSEAPLEALSRDTEQDAATEGTRALRILRARLRR